MFDGVDLEDSWILNWYFDESQRRLVFDIEASLWPGHKCYVIPLPEEYTCYKRAFLIFEGVAMIDGLLPVESVKPNISADGSIDYGNIEGLTRFNNSIYEFSGDIGKVCVKSEGVQLEFIECP